MPPIKQELERLIKLGNRAVGHFHNGNFLTAKYQLQKQIYGLEKILGHGHLRTLTALNNLASVLAKLGDFDAAITLYRRILALREKSLGADHADTLMSLANLGYALHESGHPWEAERIYDAALTRRLEVLGPNHPDTLTSLNNLAVFQKMVGRWADASANYDQLIMGRTAVQGADHPDTLTALNNLSLLKQDQGNLQDALRLQKHVLARRRIVLGERHPDTVNSISNLASLQQELGNGHEAEDLFRQALEIRRKLFGHRHPIALLSLENLAFFLDVQGRTHEAESLYRRVLKASRAILGPGHPDTIIATNNLAACYAASHPERAFSLMERAQNEELIYLRRWLSVLNPENAQIAIQNADRNLHGQISLFWQFLADKRSYAPRLVNLIVARKSIGLEILTNRSQAFLRSRYPKFRQKLERLHALRTQLAQSALSRAAMNGIEGSDIELSSLQQSFLKLEQDLIHNVKDLDVEGQSQIDWQTVAKCIPKDGLIVEFVRFSTYQFRTTLVAKPSWKADRYLAIFITPLATKVTLRDLGEASDIDALVLGFQQKILAGVSASSEGNQLRDTLFEKQFDLDASFRRLYFAPDSTLAKLAFDALPLGEGGGYLCDKYEITYLNTCRDVLRWKTQRRSRSHKPFVAAAPTFDLPLHSSLLEEGDTGNRGLDETAGKDRSSGFSGLYFSPLPGTQLEGAVISRLLGATLWTGEQVLDQPLKKLRSPSVIHIATHGFYISTDTAESARRTTSLSRHFAAADIQKDLMGSPLLRSGLALTGCQNWLRGKRLSAIAEDGLLTAEDVLTMDLRGTALVVLSACETGLGDLSVGEGIFGLGRAFTMAGVETLITSLWKVDDLATVIFMERFYAALSKGDLRASEAVQEAKRYMRQEVTIATLRDRWLDEKTIKALSLGDKLYEQELYRMLDRPPLSLPFQDPYFWGAFVIRGNPGPPFKNRHPMPAALRRIERGTVREHSGVACKS